MRNLLVFVLTLSSVAACDIVGADDEDDASQPELIALERSATTLKLQWDAIGSATAYTVDYLTGPNHTTCTFSPMHSDVQHVTGTTVTVTGLTPSTLYQIHVHPLPHGAHADASTNLILISTLAQGAATQPVSATDYTICK
ncbi:MAG: fibronectin type III domain-containing protein [Gemmatimonadota bacterium]